MSLEFPAPLDHAALPLSRHQLDRDYLSRSRPELFDELWADASTQAIVLWNGNVLLDGRGGLQLLPTGLVPAGHLRLYLGRSTAPDTLGQHYVAVVLSDEGADAFGTDDSLWGGLRVLGDSLNDLEAGLFTTALALANWHESHPFSPRTGEATEPDLGGWTRRGPDGREVFPRTDSAIIVGVLDADDRILLGHNAAWDHNRYSLLAGFVEPGESLESAVIREVFEESGIRVVDPVYLGSQPWPFPASLMLGFLARVDQERQSTLTPDGAEILDLRWFSRAELTEALGDIRLPGHTSIARAILERWYGATIDDSQIPAW